MFYRRGTDKGTWAYHSARTSRGIESGGCRDHSARSWRRADTPSFRTLLGVMKSVTLSDLSIATAMAWPAHPVSLIVHGVGSLRIDLAGIPGCPGLLQPTPVAERVDDSEYHGWSEKDCELFVQPPVSIMNDLVAVRLHLDYCDECNGALRVYRRTCDPAPLI